VEEITLDVFSSTYCDTLSEAGPSSSIQSTSAPITIESNRRKRIYSFANFANNAGLEDKIHLIDTENDSLQLPHDQHSFYKLLDLKGNEAPDEIIHAYKRKAKLIHPDLQQDELLKTQATEEFQRLALAYSVLKDPLKRQAYNNGNWNPT
jgi:hypothetical protein